MKNMTIAILTGLLLTTVPKWTVKAQEPILRKVAATIYCSGTITADGSKVREGIAAVAPEHIGETVLIYTLERELLLIAECKDTGGATIKSGKVIDVYFDSKEAGQKFIDKTYENGGGGNVLIQFVQAEG